ncbi:MAG: PadR family transcriptional regulator [Candidatus Geothermarchaeales archaeon]
MIQYGALHSGIFGGVLLEGEESVLRVYRRSIKSILDLIILVLLESTPAMGAYDIISSIHNKFNILVSPGTIYPILKILEERGLIEIELKERKKVYRLTEEGRAKIEALIEEFVKTHQKIFNVLGIGARRGELSEKGMPF